MDFIIWMKIYSEARGLMIFCLMVGKWPHSFKGNALTAQQMLVKPRKMVSGWPTKFPTGAMSTMDNGRLKTAFGGCIHAYVDDRKNIQTK